MRQRKINKVVGSTIDSLKQERDQAIKQANRLRAFVGKLKQQLESMDGTVMFPDDGTTGKYTQIAGLPEQFSEFLLNGMREVGMEVVCRPTVKVKDTHEQYDNILDIIKVLGRTVNIHHEHPTFTTIIDAVAEEILRENTSTTPNVDITSNT